MRVLLDTSVVIDVLNARKERQRFMRELLDDGHALGCCAVTVAEVYAGMRRDEVRATEELLNTLDYYETTRSAAQCAGHLKAVWSRKGRTLGLPDALIAATAIELGLALATDNRKHFPMSELKLLSLPALH